jgi:hypothetical protein
MAVGDGQGGMGCECERAFVGMEVGDGMESVAQGNLASLVFLGALMVVIAFLLLRSQRYFARQEQMAMPAPEDVESRAPTSRKPAHHLGTSSELVQWEVEMHDMARDLSGQLDSKMSVLEHLIRDADRAAARLEAALAAMQQAGVAPSAPRPPTHEVDRLEPAEPPARPADQADALKTAGPVNEPPRAAERPPADRRYEEIYMLADYGFAPAEIAHRVSMPIGEIQLILGLRAKR